jgi:hypothetical protein
MKQTSLAASLLLLLIPATASAGGSAGSIGVGAELDTLGNGDISGNYDFGQFHVGASFGFSDSRPTGGDTLRIGGRGYYHLHSTALADFGLGGELHIVNVDSGGGNDATAVEILLGFQIRSFISTNVALSFTGGVVIGTSDSDGFAVGGAPLAAAGVHYYFF